jgi:hypothetical protein
MHRDATERLSQGYVQLARAGHRSLTGHMPIGLAIELYPNWEFTTPDFESTFERERRLELQRKANAERNNSECPF